jgi:parallel beta-helix repeat protein
LSNNNAANNGYGIYLYYSSDNIILHNNFLNNTQQTGVSNSANTWDDGYPSGGNYWSDYLTKYPNATEVGSSGIWNTPYVTDADNTDHYPLTNQTIISEFPSHAILLLLMFAIAAVVISSRRQSKTSRDTRRRKLRL